LHKKALAEAFGVSVNTVASWVRRGLPSLKKRGPRKSLLFDKQAAEQWLAAQGIVPGAKGREGGKARAAQSKAAGGRGGRKHGAITTRRKGYRGSEVGAQKTAGGDGLGLDAAISRLAHEERRLSRLLGRSESATERLSLTKTRNEVIRELRLAKKESLEIRVREGQLITYDQHLAAMTKLAAVVRERLEGFSDEVVPRVVRRMQEQGVEMGDSALFERTLYDETRRCADTWLSRLSGEIRGGGAEVPV